MIVKLEAEKHQLKLKNESLLLSNSKLQTKLQWSETLQSVERQQVLQPLYLHFYYLCLKRMHTGALTLIIQIQGIL